MLVKNNKIWGSLWVVALFLLSSCLTEEPRKVGKPGSEKDGQTQIDLGPSPSPSSSPLPSMTPTPTTSPSPSPSPRPSNSPSPSPSIAPSPTPSTSPRPSPSPSVAPSPSPSLAPSPSPSPLPSIAPDPTAKAPFLSGTFFPQDANPRFEWFSLTGATEFRYKLDNPDLSTGATETSSTFLRVPQNLSPGTHTFYVQERLSNGGWSPSASMTGTINVSSLATGRPGVSLDYDEENRRVSLVITSSGRGNTTGYYEVSIDDPEFTTSGGWRLGNSVISTRNLILGEHTFYVREGFSDPALSSRPIGGAVTMVSFNHTFTPPPDFRVRAIVRPNDPRPKLYILDSQVDDPLLNSQDKHQAKANDPDMTTGAFELDPIRTRNQTPMNLTTGNHVLYVQGRENQTLAWSSSFPVPMSISLTPGQPNPPIVKIQPNLLEPWKPTFTWDSGGGGNGNYRYKVASMGTNYSTLDQFIDMIESTVNANSLDRGANTTTAQSVTLNLRLGDSYVLLVQERNAAGVWSASGFEFIIVTLILPIGPIPTPAPGPGGAYWFRGDYNQSCTEVCAPHGGYHSATQTYAGSDGAMDNCRAIISSSKMEGGARFPTLISNGPGFGCFLMDSAMRDQVPTTAAAKSPLVKRVCGCNLW